MSHPRAAEHLPGYNLEDDLPRIPRLACLSPSLNFLRALRAPRAAPTGSATETDHRQDLDPRGLDVDLLVSVVLCRIKMMMIGRPRFSTGAQTRRVGRHRRLRLTVFRDR